MPTTRPIVPHRIRIISFCIALAVSAACPQVIMNFVGDCTIGCDARWPVFDDWVRTRGHGWFFSRVKVILGEDDYTVANLETTIIDSGVPLEKQFRFRGRPEYLNILKDGSVEGVTMANNHSWDYGDSGYALTQRNLERFGIDYFAYDRILRKTIKGLSFAFIGQSFKLQDSALSRIRALRDSVDFIIVCIHWGEERRYVADKKQIAMGHALVDAGADLVVGHHPHVLQPVEKYKKKWIAYSLGNFVFGGNVNPRDKKTMILQVRFEKGRSPAVRKLPCLISSVDTLNDFRPVLLDSGDRKKKSCSAATPSGPFLSPGSDTSRQDR